MGWQERYPIRLCQTFLKFRDPILCDMQAKILNQNGLHEVISSVRLLLRGLPDQYLGCTILIRVIDLFEAFKQRRNEGCFLRGHRGSRSEEHTSELQSPY